MRLSSELKILAAILPSPTGKKPRYRLYRKTCGLHSRSGRCGEKNYFPAEASSCIIILALTAFWSSSSQFYYPFRFKEHRRLVPFMWVYSIKYNWGGMPIGRWYPRWLVELSHVSNALILITLFELPPARCIIRHVALGFIVTYHILHYEKVIFSWWNMHRYNL
jgi:hypothetical protein